MSLGFDRTRPNIRTGLPLSSAAEREHYFFVQLDNALLCGERPEMALLNATRSYARSFFPGCDSRHQPTPSDDRGDNGTLRADGDHVEPGRTNPPGPRAASDR